MPLTIPRNGRVVSCTRCDKKVYCSKSRLDKAKTYFCSMKCKGKIFRKPLDIKCPVCNNKFRSRYFNPENPKRKICCSRSCKHQLLMSKMPIEKLLEKRLYSITERSKKLGIKSNITLSYLIKLYDKQNGICAYSGIGMRNDAFNFHKFGQPALDALSVDKIVPKKGYIKGNAVLCCSGINRLKGSVSVDEFLSFLNRIIPVKSL